MITYVAFCAAILRDNEEMKYGEKWHESFVFKTTEATYENSSAPNGRPVDKDKYKLNDHRYLKKTVLNDFLSYTCKRSIIIGKCYVNTS